MDQFQQDRADQARWDAIRSDVRRRTYESMNDFLVMLFITVFGGIGAVVGIGVLIHGLFFYTP